MNLIKEKLVESLKSVLPIALIVIGLGVTIVPMNTGDMFLFLVGIVCLVFGMSLFTAGAEMSMQPLGSKIGSTIGASRKIWLIALVSFVIGILVTISEPDLVILADQVDGMDGMSDILIWTVSVGVGIFLLIAVMRIVFNWNLTYIMIGFYALAFILAFFVDKSFLPLSFDSGGVASGTMMSAFVLPLCMGACMERGGDVMTDAFGCVAFVAMAPIITIQISGFAYKLKAKK